jgi:ABC-type Fe3+-hydroxamate transport system substrate-binding protein
LEEFTDQMNRTIRLEHLPARIISVVPSQTELLYSLGLDDQVIGITKFCVHPPTWFRSKSRVGGTKNLNLDVIRSLKPDLIIGNKEENNQEQITQLMTEYPVWMSDIHTLEDACQMIVALGSLTGRMQEAETIRIGIETSFSALPTPLIYQNAAYFIWRNPYMVAGTGTFIHEMLGKCGLKNVFEQGRYPVINAEELRLAAPELILLSNEPYPFKEKHILEFRQISPSSRILVVDGELFSWYGSRLLQAPAYFQHLFFPE